MVQHKQLREVASLLFKRAIERIRGWDPRVTLRKNILWSAALVLFVLGWLLCRPAIGLNAAGAICIELCALCLLYGLIVCALKLTHSWPNFRQNRPSLASIGAFVLISAFTTFFVAHKVFSDRTVYTWDSINYWSKGIAQSAAYLQDPFAALSELYKSILELDSNYFTCLFLALPVQIFGNSFAALALIIQLMFNLPALWVLATAGKKLLERMHVELPWWFCYLVASLCPSLFFPSASGYPDSLGLIFAAVLMLLIVDFDWHHPQTAHVALMGFTLPLCMIAQGYFAFFVINFALLFATASVIAVLQTRKGKAGRTLMRCAVSFVVIGALTVGLMLIFFSDLFYRTLDTNFSLIYSAYNRGDFFEKFQNVGYFCGGIVILMALAGAIAGIVRGRTRGLSVGMLIGAITSCLLLFQIQNMGSRQLLLIEPALLLFLTMALGTLWSAVKKKPLRQISMGLCLALLAANSCIAWTTLLLPKENLGGLFVVNKMLPERRSDLDELHEFADYVNEQGGDVYILASSQQLNNQTLQYLDYPEQTRPIERQFDVADVDLRDGFPMQFFVAEIVAVPDPLQYHLVPEDQRIVGALAQHFLDGTGYARHYERLKSFELDGDITLTVYRKFEDWEQEDYDALREEFAGYYPEYPELFADRIHP